MLEEEGQVLGEIGEAMGRSVEAWSGIGGLEKKEGCFADIFREEKKRTGWGDRALMRASLRDAQNSQTLSFPLSFHSGIGRRSGEKEDRTERKENSDFGLWFALHSLVCWWSLVACLLTDGFLMMIQLKEWTGGLYLGRGGCWRAGSF